MARLLFDCMYCLRDVCNKEPVDGMSPCLYCDELYNAELSAECED